ncbi:MAG: hypothetical protein QXM12_01030, partial [Nitrososphaerota archaeon]
LAAVMRTLAAQRLNASAKVSSITTNLKTLPSEFNLTFLNLSHLIGLRFLWPLPEKIVKKNFFSSLLPFLREFAASLGGCYERR